MRPCDGNYDRNMAAADAAMREIIDVDGLAAGDTIHYEDAEQIQDPAWHDLQRILRARGLELVDDGDWYEVREIEQD